MRIKRKNGLKIAAITIALLLCLALAVGITGAFYQAKRQATGTLSMDQGIIIDYKGFDKTPDEGIWTRENKTTFLLFDETNAQPGEQIAVNAAGIRANEKSVNFYARVKLSYKFYNVSGETETEVTLANTSDLITTSANFFGTNWVDGGGTDGYYYYATGLTLNKFEKGAAATMPFVNLFATDAEFVIEGENFTGATSNGEGGGFVVGETSINKIEVYLTLETLQGDATAEQAKALGWKIAQTVDFSKVEEGKIVKSNTTTEVTDEKLNVTINDKTTSLETVKFPYDEEVILNFDSRNVDYITLNYSNGETETFGLSADDFANDYLSETALKVTAKSSKGTVKGYTVGLWDSEYKDFIYSKIGYNEDGTTYEIDNELSVSGYFDTKSEITIPKLAKVRNRNFKIEVPFSNRSEFVFGLMNSMGSIAYPCQLTYKKNELEVKENLRNLNDLIDLFNDINNNYSDEKFLSIYSGPMIFTFTALCETTSVLTKESNISIIGTFAFASNTNLTTINISNNIKKIEGAAFWYCSNLSNIFFGSAIVTIHGDAFAECSSLESITIPDSVTSIGDNAFEYCSGLTSVTIGNGATSIGDCAFNSCETLNTITIKAINPPTLLGYSAIPSGVTAIYVPKDSVGAYKTADGWKNFADKIQAIA